MSERVYDEEPLEPTQDSKIARWEVPYVWMLYEFSDHPLFHYIMSYYNDIMHVMYVDRFDDLDPYYSDENKFYSKESKTWLSIKIREFLDIYYKKDRVALLKFIGLIN